MSAPSSFLFSSPFYYLFINKYYNIYTIYILYYQCNPYSSYFIYMITPYIEEEIHQFSRGLFLPPHKVVSFGLSNSGYGLRLSNKSFRLLETVDVKSKSVQTEIILQEDDLDCWFEMPPHSCGIGFTLEVITMPTGSVGVCLGNTIYTRVGVIMSTVVIEPTWTGHIKIELANTSPKVVRIYANEGIAQLHFFKDTLTTKI